MAPVLYMQDVSPPARSVLLTAAALGVKLELKIIDVLKKEQLNEEFKKVGLNCIFFLFLIIAIDHNISASNQYK